MVQESVTSSLMSRVPEDARTILIVGFERHDAAKALAARPGADIVCIEWYDNALADAQALFRTVIPMPLGGETLALCSQPFDCIVVCHLKGLSISLPQALVLLEPCLDERGTILFSVANPSYGPYSIIEHCQIGFTPVEVFDFAADAGLRLTSRWSVVDPKAGDARIDESGHVTLFGERYPVELPDTVEDLIALEHHYSAIRTPAAQPEASSPRPTESPLRSF